MKTTTHFRQVLMLLLTLAAMAVGQSKALAYHAVPIANSFSGGEGTLNNPYIIGNDGDWDQLATDVAAGTSYSDQYFRLDADISVETMVGTGTSSSDAKSFNGTFDGNGHKLTVNYTSDGDVATAPFRFLRDATIRNLHVDGEITANHKYAAGLAGRTYGTTLITGCRVSTVISSSVGGDATHGGIVALKPNWESARLTIEGCVFDGKILTTGTPASHSCGGFVGYTSYGSLTIRNCIFAPETPTADETAVSEGCTFYRFPNKNAGIIIVENCYYTEALGTAQGKQARSVDFGEGVFIDIIPVGSATEYGASGIIGYAGNQCVKHNGWVFAGNGDVMELKFNHNFGDSEVHYSIYKSDGNYDALHADENGIYTVTMSDDFVELAAQANAPAIEAIGDGTAEHPYLIYDDTRWDYYVSLVNKGEGSYDNAYYKLIADIAVTTMMGSKDHPFRGHFDGDGHTLTVSYFSGNKYAAPFCYVRGAAFINLRVDGYIATSNLFAGGLIGNAGDNTTITNCRSSVTIDSSFDGEGDYGIVVYFKGNHGGFVGYNEGGTLTITGCAFDGYMIGGKTKDCAGFVGWNETYYSDDYGFVNIRDCLFAPKGVEQYIERTFVVSNDYNHVNITNSHCTNDYRNYQQSRIYRITSSEDVSMKCDASISTIYSVSGIVFHTVGLEFDGVLYARETDNLPLYLVHLGPTPIGCEFKQFATTAGTLNGNTLNVSNANATIYAVYTNDGRAWGGTGSGTESNPYIINSTERWEEFANRVNYGVEIYATAYYRLQADITVTNMVGTSAYKFKGHFDGNGHTLTLSYGSEDAPVSGNFCAPFRYIDAADIHDLNVEGVIHTNRMFAAGIAGLATGDNRIDNCRVSVAINSKIEGDGSHGGFVATIQNGYTFITRCAFNGSMTGRGTNSCGGFVGWTDRDKGGIASLSNCLFKPEALTIDISGCATFSRGSGITLEDCYYTSLLGDKQGMETYAYDPEYSITPLERRSIAGVNYYLTKTIITDVEATDITHLQAYIKWTALQACDSYQVRYREKNVSNATYFTNFEYSWPGGWTRIDADGDGNNWEYYIDSERSAHSRYGCFFSESFRIDYGAMNPDNWLVSPEVSLGGTVRVWLKSQYPGYGERFAIYLSKDGNFVDENKYPLSSLIPLVPESGTTYDYQEYVADLTPFSGERGRIAIRHFNSNSKYYIALDDFGVYPSGDWTTVSGATPAGTLISGLKPETSYEYQVVYQYGGKTYYSPFGAFTTAAASIPPADLNVTDITDTRANISWTGNADSYNLRYGKHTGEAMVTLSVPESFWQDGSGYQMLLDPNHDTYGTIIPESGPLTTEGPASAETYDHFMYKIPQDADGALNTTNIVDGKTVTSCLITIPAGTYDWCITNPSPGDCVWIASSFGSMKGRGDDFVFEAGMNYTFTITESGFNSDRVELTITDEIFSSMTNVTDVTDITGTSHALSSLDPSTLYFVYVQSVKDGRTSPWCKTSFTTLREGELYLYDDKESSHVLADYVDQTRSVTLFGRTLYKDGSWNTLCLPFDLDLEGSPLEGAVAKTLDVQNTTMTGTHVHLVFSEPVPTLWAGTPYIIKWDSGDDIVNPVFKDVLIETSSASADDLYSSDGCTFFYGTFDPINITTYDYNLYYMTADNTLKHTAKSRTLKGFRAYFWFFPNNSSVKPLTFDIDFGDGEATGMQLVESGELRDECEIYDLAGRRVAQPTKGIYIVNGKKVYVK